MADFSSVRAIYFDLDDTLCGYWDASKKGLRKAFGEHGPEGLDVEEMVREWSAAFREFAPSLKRTGWYEGYLQSGEATRTESMRLALMRMGVDEPERARKLSEAYLQHRHYALSLFPEAREVLNSLRGRYPLGLITNGPADIQRMEIEGLGIGTYFDNVFIEGELGFGKPKPEVFERAAAAVSCSPDELLFVGNSYAHDIAPALAAGWFAAWVRRPSDVPPSSGPEKTEPEEKPEGGADPHMVINNLRQLLPLLGRTPINEAR